MKAILLLFNIQKKNNLGMLIRTANALGVHELCVVGRKEYSSYGNHKTNTTTQKRHFFRYQEAVDFYRARGYDLVGVEISKAGKPVQLHPFRVDTVFIVGNEAKGLSEAQIASCDYCVYIPQYGCGASLNVNVAAGIVINHFAVWNNSPESPIDGHQFNPKSPSPF